MINTIEEKKSVYLYIINRKFLNVYSLMEYEDIVFENCKDPGGWLHVFENMSMNSK